MPYKALRVRHMHLLLGSDTCTFTAMVMNTIMDTTMNIFNHSPEHERGFIHEHIHEHGLEHDHIHEHIHELDICGWHTLHGIVMITNIICYWCYCKGFVFGIIFAAHCFDPVVAVMHMACVMVSCMVYFEYR